MDVLLDKSIPLKVRVLRAEAILMVGKIFQSIEMDPGQPSNEGYKFEKLLGKSQTQRLMKKDGS